MACPWQQSNRSFGFIKKENCKKGCRQAVDKPSLAAPSKQGKKFSKYYCQTVFLGKQKLMNY